MTAKDKRLAILYWGSRGGGQLLTHQLISQANDMNLFTVTFLRPVTQDGLTQLKIVAIRRWLSERKHVIRECKRLKIDHVIIPMASPWDLFLGTKFRKNGMQVTRIIHDATPHPGDVFPPKLWIKALCFDCSRIVTLSKYVTRRLVALEYAALDKIHEGKLPVVDIFLEEDSFKESSLKNFLFVGRGKPYKGLELLLATWPLVGESDWTLTIAGEGHKVSENFNRVYHIDRWLEDNELISLIKHSDVVVLPYVEASQSGIIPLATSLRRPVVITPVGGLSEQVQQGVNGIISSGTDKQSLAAALELVSTSQFTFEKEEKKDDLSESLLRTCIDKM
jgi:glycosyltransferase involved in cell wall biosynthesis